MSLFILFVVLLFSCNSKKTESSQPGQNSTTDTLQLLAKQYPDSIQLQLKLQEAIYTSGDTALALKNLLQLVEDFPNNEKYQQAMAVIHLQKGDTISALQALISCLAINQNQPEIEFELAFIQAAKRQPSALFTAQRLIDRYNEKDIQAKGHFVKGIYYTNDLQPKQAIQEFDSAIIKNFTLIDAYIEKGILQYESGNASGCINTLSKAVALDKNNADILFWLGKAYQQKNEFDQALLYFRETLKLDPTHIAAQEAMDQIKHK